MFSIISVLINNTKELFVSPDDREMHKITAIYLCFCLLINIPQFTKNKRKKKKKGKGKKKGRRKMGEREEGKEKDGERRGRMRGMEVISV